MEKTNIFIFAIIVLFMVTSCDMIGDRQYEVSELNGVYVIRNYDKNMPVGPRSGDTLYLRNGRYKNHYFGEGTAEIGRQRTHAIILFRYVGSLGKKHASGFHIDKPLFQKLRLTINSDLNYYYERISKDCPDVFDE